ncbi:transcription termination/antitermination NusG family protein [Chengkuizengella axinellae]|uniref:Transcription termination/antitermination NusG family protein n=1 Tax=Chengkuizengella axinellae TaxID=3064388 RepID=A0ABT9J3E6_9BACL|nr:transcription termination/antitermination NusG family protein [Chengkuizengella sp. 2205SS18-9]MDP5276141.1 transcription termination/antitermination NusG family protein [Chengkuizengella sp. 2205SS18-9]
MWYVVHVWKNEERSVARLVTPYVQEVMKLTKIDWVPTARGLKRQSVAMMPGYILIKERNMSIELCSSIRKLPCVVSILSDSKHNPIAIPNEAIQSFVEKLKNEKTPISISDLIIETENQRDPESTTSTRNDQYTILKEVN